MASLFAMGGTPRFVPLGAKDSSIKVPPRGKEQYPQHLPKFFILAEKGPFKDMIVSGSVARMIYGDLSFNKVSPFFKHSTQYAIGAMGEGQEVMIQRIVPEDIGPRSNVALYLDYQEAKIPNYQRDSKGNVVRDTTDTPVIDPDKPTIDGYEIKWVTDYNTEKEPIQPGLLTPKAGTMTREETQSVPTGNTIDVEVGTGTFKDVSTITVDDTTTLLDKNNMTGGPDASESTTDIVSAWRAIVTDPARGNEGIDDGSAYSNVRALELKPLVVDTEPTVTNPGAYVFLAKGASDNYAVTINPAYRERVKISGVKSWDDQDNEIDVDVSGFTADQLETTLTEINVKAGAKTLDLATHSTEYPWNEIKVEYDIEKRPDTTRPMMYKDFVNLDGYAHNSDIVLKLSVLVNPTKVVVKQEEIMTTEQRPEMKDQQVTVPSRMIPIAEFRAKYNGAYYDNIGFSINSSYLRNFNTMLASRTKLYPYTFQIVTREDAKSSPTTFRSMSAENEVEFFFTDVPTMNPLIESRLDLPYIFKSEWYNETDPLKPYKPFDMEIPFIYTENFEGMLKKILENETKNISFDPVHYKADDEDGRSIDWYDFEANSQEELTDQFRLLNLFTCKTSKNIKLQTVALSKAKPVLRDNLAEVNMASNQPIFLKGGSDGSLTDENFEKETVKQLRKYNDMDSDVQELAYNVESTFWDSGYTLETKFEIVNFISLRKDTYIALSTHTVNKDNRVLPSSQENAVATALNTRLKLAPESVFYGTPVTRGVIVKGAGLLADDSSDVYYPQNYDLMVKTARFAGAGDGDWKREYLFDHGDAAVIKTMKELKPSFIPHSMKATLWNRDVIYSQRFDRENYFFPALQTVYPHENSVLNSYFLVMGLATVTKVGFDTWKNFTGSISLTPAEFKDQVEKFATKNTTGRFANILNVVPVCEISDADMLRGYSWKLRFKVGANNMKTVCVYDTEVFRMGEEEL